MPGSAWTLVGAGGLLLCWLVLMAVLWLTRSDELPGRELLRLLPDVLRWPQIARCRAGFGCGCGC
ncbi:MAG: hypothetical protein ACJ71Y_10890 [Blastococcus sp.]